MFSNSKLILLIALALVAVGCSSDDSPVAPVPPPVYHTAQATAEVADRAVATLPADVAARADFLLVSLAEGDCIVLARIQAETVVYAVDLFRGSAVRVGPDKVMHGCMPLDTMECLNNGGTWEECRGLPLTCI